MLKYVIFYAIAFLYCQHLTCQPTEISGATWKIVGRLPSRNNEEHKGLAGLFAGIHHNILLVAGGSNFPQDPPWEGGEKRWYDTIYALKINPDDTYSWIGDISQVLPEPLASGVSVTLEQGILCIGGSNQFGPSSQVLLLGWNTDSEEVTITKYPNLPKGFEADAGVKLGNRIVVHGILKNRNAIGTFDLVDHKWEIDMGCPGLPRRYCVSAAQNAGNNELFYLFGGRYESRDTATVFKDYYSFDPNKNSWKHGQLVENGREFSVMAGSALPVGSNQIFLFGGDPGDRFLRRDELERKLKRADNIGRRKTIAAQLANEFKSHPGFTNVIMCYNTVTGLFEQEELFPKSLPVAGKVVYWYGSIYLVCGELRPGVRTPAIWKKTKAAATRVNFGWLNYAVLTIYFALLLGIGFYFSSRQTTSTDYFKGGKRIPWWAAGLSLFGTSLSAITFVAIPAKTYAADWSYFFFQMAPIFVLPLIAKVYIPFFRRLDVSTAYEYLERRFNYVTRLLGSVSFILFQLGRIGIVLYLPALVLSLVTDINIDLCILLMGIISIVYTMMGGIEAVIWTDVLQVIVLLGGAIVCLTLIYDQTDMEFSSVFTRLYDQNKLKILDLTLNVDSPTLWVVILGGVFSNLIASGSDQTMVQRYLTTKDEKSAIRSARTFAWLALPTTLLFFSLGTALFVFYDTFPSHLNPGLQNDGVFPWYIVSELPAGVSGLVISGLFSAAMSSLSSSMNSAATAYTSDIYNKLYRTNHSNDLRVGRWATFIVGVFGVGFAILMASWDIKSLWDQFQLILGLCIGGLGGLFLLGMTTTRANSTGALIGLVGSCGVQLLLSKYTSMNVLLFSMTGFVSCYLIGWAVSFFSPPDKTNLNGLTIFTRKKSREENS